MRIIYIWSRDNKINEDYFLSPSIVLFFLDDHKPNEDFSFTSGIIAYQIMFVKSSMVLAMVMSL